MAPTFLRQREKLPRERFVSYFSGLKTQAYYDPAAARALSYHDPAATEKGEIIGVRSISWNPLSTLVATGSSDKSIRVWNPEKPNVQHSTQLKGHTAPVEKVAFNPVRDAELCSVSADGVVKFWDVRTKACVNEVRNLGDTFTLAWAPDGDSLVVGNRENDLHVLSPTQPTPLITKRQPARTNDLAFCWGGKKLFAASSDGRTRILSFPDLEPCFRGNFTAATSATDDDDDDTSAVEFALRGHTAECLTVAMSPTGRHLATGGSDAIIALWDTAKWTCQRTITKMLGPVCSLSFSWDGNYVVGGSSEGTGLEVTRPESGDHIYTFKTAQPVPVVSWAPTRYFLAYSELGSLRIVGVDTERRA
ncbi:WD repeat-containing protein [Grosmannia clavigera kw1407]|uniref:WD repeat-containing protein n=1 Tax=Grosmannia clavigera (strain kw1407 / UAMH 11150) TaxID=655863 RepID=F0XC84_GROCL|nr:WD repeat-containing protein [Grosmannia clavigera kw1407]EFX03960.1 WD repeat-containing protein [Grosmannia clavigera kw1407]